jgi:hypothetical protein
VGREAKLGGYQLMIAADILRGRYRSSFTDPKPIPAGKSQVFRIALPTANHVFLPGHRIMVQVQSSWFPLYDRNPQAYVENIFFAKPGDYRQATIKIFSGGRNPSFVELPVVKTAQAHYGGPEKKRRAPAGCKAVGRDAVLRRTRPAYDLFPSFSRLCSTGGFAGAGLGGCACAACGGCACTACGAAVVGGWAVFPVVGAWPAAPGCGADG